MYLGCLLIPAIILIFLAISLVKGLMNMGFNILSIISFKINNIINGILDFFTAPFRDKPVESELDDPNYYRETEERPKRYERTDGEYTSYKKVKH